MEGPTLATKGAKGLISRARKGLKADTAGHTGHGSWDDREAGYSSPGPVITAQRSRSSANGPAPHVVATPGWVHVP